MTVEIGKKSVGKTVYIPRAVLTESVPGQRYELNISTNGIQDQSQVVKVLTSELPNKFKGLKIHWIRVDNNSIRMEIEGSPFVWATLLLFLPEILLTIGVVVTFIAVFLVVSAVPSWAWAIFAIGAILIIFGGGIGRKILGEKKIE